MSGPEDGADQATQEGFEPSEEATVVVAGGGEDGVGAVIVVSLEMVMAHAMAVLGVVDHGLDRDAAFHLPADSLGDPAYQAGDPDPRPVWKVCPR